jgi:hypothetical protein
MRSSSTAFALSLALVASLAATTTARAQSNTELVDKASGEQSEAEVTGWNGELSVSGNANLTSNSQVVGETDGFAALLGLNLTGNLNYVSGPHQLENTLHLSESFARTPSIDRFVKNNDSLGLESLYQYFFVPWAGTFGQATFETSLFTTNNVTGSPRDYEVTRNDGTPDTFNQTQSFELTGPLTPTSLSETIGLFVKPVRETPFTLSIRGGIGARETFASNALVVSESPESGPIQVESLRNIYQGGAEAFVGIKGKLPDRNISYDLGANGFLPVINNSVDDRTPTELFRYGLNGNLTFHAVEWMSVSYNARILRDPQLIDRTQVQNNVLLNFSYSLIEPRDPADKKEEPTKLEKARQRAAEAERRVEELEEKLEETDSEETDGDRESEPSGNGSGK